MNTHKTYWNSEGKHQILYKRLWKKLVPPIGEANTPHGELLRANSKLYYDFYNNGFCNIEMLSSEILTIREWQSELGDDEVIAKFLAWLDKAALKQELYGYMYPLKRIFDAKPTRRVQFERLLEEVSDRVIGLVAKIEKVNV
jgi:hypothetical protein